MFFNDEKDYIMRIIKEMTKMLGALMLGKENSKSSIEVFEESRVEITRTKPNKYEDMVDAGQINEAENLLVKELDFGNMEEVFSAVLFYKYISEKDDEFLKAHDYTKEEALDGIRWLAEKTGYGSVCKLYLGE